MSPAKRTAEKARAHRAVGVGDRAFEAAKNAGSAVNGAADAVGLSERVSEHPYGMVGAALAVGYVAGGGLFTPTTMRLIQLGVKLASVPFVQNQLLEVAETAVDSLLQQTRKLNTK